MSQMRKGMLRRRIGVITSFLALIAIIALPALAKTPKLKRPTVAIIRAEWCSACQKLEPTIMELKSQYGDRIDFVILDVSNDEKAAESARVARKLGLSTFFDENKQRTSTVLVLSASRKIIFQTRQNFDRDAYVKAFDDALAKG
jgi:thiol-disulfide isomerase/thioredoxin